MKLNDVQANNINDTVNLFAKKFSSVYTASNISYRNITSILNNRLSIISFTEDEVSKCIDELSDTLSPGPDKVHVLFIKNCKSVLVGPLTNLFNPSIKTGIYPQILKESFINPGYKSGDAQDVYNGI